LEGDPNEWTAGIAVLIVVHRTKSVLLAMVVGVGTLLVVRGSGAAIV
jgi:branched-subunit amino acid transport protein